MRVHAATEGSVDTDLCRRCKHLSHISEADIVFVEVDLEGVVGAEGLTGVTKGHGCAQKRENARTLLSPT